MSHEAINNWVLEAKDKQKKLAKKTSEIEIIMRGEEIRNNGTVIMEISDKIRPFLQKLFTGVRDENGMLLQPAHVRGIALNVAQCIVKKQDEAK